LFQFGSRLLQGYYMWGFQTMLPCNYMDVNKYINFTFI
jgi:hypothetical protein